MTRARDERGFALLAVLLVLAILGVLGAEFAYAMRLEVSAVRAYKDGILAAHLAEAGINRALREIAADWAFVTGDEDGDLTFYGRDRLPMARHPRQEVELGSGRYTYRIRDEEALLNLNTAQPGRFEALLDALGVQRGQRDQIVASVQDWRDPNEEHRANGAESEDYYLKLTVPYRTRNGNLETVAELLQIRGITPAIYHGGLADAVTVRTTGQVNINTAGALVLRGLGLSDAEIGAVLQTRRDTPYSVVPGPLAGRGFSVATRTFRVTAEGIVHGRVAARITAVLRKQAENNVLVLEWSGVR
jgi:general secretion pathway protein K